MKVRRVIIGIICACCIMNIIFVKEVKAAESATVDITLEKENVEVGAEVNVSVKVSAERNISGIDGNLIYDPNILEFKEGAYCENTEEGCVKISNMDEEESTEKQYKITFLAKQAGSSSLKFEGKPTVCNVDEIWLEPTCNEENIEVSEEVSDDVSDETQETTSKDAVSSDASLAYIKVSPGKLDKEFDSEELSYNVAIDNEYSSIDIQAEATDSNAQVYIDNKQSLSVGWNKINIIVTAQDNTINKYVLSVYRKEQSTNITESESQSSTVAQVDAPEEDDDVEEIIESFAIKEIDGNIYLVGDYNYEIVKLDDVSMIPAGYLQSKVVLYGKTIVAYTKKDSEDNDFFLVYAQNTDTGEKNFYQYDRIENTMQRYFNDDSKITNNSSEDQSDAIEKYKKSLAICIMIIALLLSALILIMIFIIKLVMKLQDIKRDVFD